MSKQKTILYIGGFELPDKNAAANRVVSNAIAFKKLGYNVKFLGISRSRKYGKIFDENVYIGFENYSIGYPKASKEWLEYLTRNKLLCEFIDGMQNKPSIIVAYNYPGVALGKLRRYCRKHNIKLIADCTEWYLPTGNIVFKILKKIDTHIRMVIVHPRLDGMIAISKYLYNYYNGKMDKVVCVPPLVDTFSEKYKTDVVATDKSDIKRLVYAGSPGTNKDSLDLIISALTKIKGTFDIQFTIYGLTYNQYLEIYGEEISDELLKKIDFKGRVAHCEALQGIKNADFVIFVRKDNLVTKAGFPTKFVEAISCGTPVLTNFSSNISDYLIEGKNGFSLDIENCEKLAESLNLKLDVSKDKINQMKTFCKDSNMFDCMRYADEFKKILGM